MGAIKLLGIDMNEQQIEIRRQRAKAWNRAHPERVRERNAAWLAANPEKVSEYAAKYRSKNSERLRDVQRRWKEAHPWYWSWQAARQRCTNPRVPRFNRYGGRGIKFLLTKEDCAEIWQRDRAWELKRPSLDRIDNDGNYEKGNCRFISASENSQKRWTDGAALRGAAIRARDPHQNGAGAELLRNP